MRPRSRVSAREETVVAAEAGYAYASTLADHIDSQSRPGTSIYSDVDVVVTENAEHYLFFWFLSAERRRNFEKAQRRTSFGSSNSGV